MYKIKYILVPYLLKRNINWYFYGIHFYENGIFEIWYYKNIYAKIGEINK